MNTKTKKLILIIALVLFAWMLKITLFSSAVVNSTKAGVNNEISSKQTNEQANKFSQQKIITLAPHVVEMLFDIGVGDRIVGTTEHSDYPAQALEIPLIGNYARLKIEDILALQPDLIIAWRTGNPSDDLERLEQLGLKVVYSDPRYLSDISKELRLFGQLTGANELAEKKASQFESRLNALRQRFEDKGNINVFYELWSKPLTTIAQQAWPQQHIEVCGANNIFVDLVNDYPQINIEQIIINDPQLIIQPMSNGEPNPDAIDWQKFKQVKAAKYQQQLKPNSDILHRMSFRLLDELEQLCIDIDKSRDFYQNLSSATQN